MFNLSLCHAATIRYSQLKLGHMHLCGMDYNCFSPHFCKCNSFGCTVAIRCGNAYHGSHSDSLDSGSEHSQFNSPRLVKREAGFPNPRRALIDSNQLWRINDSPYYRELTIKRHCLPLTRLPRVAGGAPLVNHKATAIWLALRILADNEHMRDGNPVFEYIYSNFYGHLWMNASKIWLSYLQVLVLYPCQILQAYKP